MPPSRKSTSTHYDSGSCNRSYSSRSGRSSGRLTIFDWVIRVPIALLLLGFMGFYLLSGATMDVEKFKATVSRLPEFPAFVMEQMQKKSDAQKAYEETAVQDSYYVKSIGRYCDWDDEMECYYDPETDCYFWYNDTTKTHTWQYWYEDISSDYGDYGWMEFDSTEKQWYIEVSDGEWIELPSEYDRSNLWHVE